MNADTTNEKTRGDLVRRFLLNYLRASSVVRWPGVDGLTEDDILDHYPQVRDAGEVPACPELCRKHAELITEIQLLFTLKGWSKHPDS